MQDVYYSALGFIALLTHLIINFNQLFKNPNPKNTSGRTYKRYLWSVLAFFIIDCLWGIFRITNNITLLFIDTELYYIAMALTVVLWCSFAARYLNLMDLLGKFLKIFGNAFFLIELILLAINPFKNIYFSYASDAAYNPGIARYFTYTAILIMFTITAITTLIKSNHTKNSSYKRFSTISLFSLTMIISIVLQIQYPLLPMYAIGLMIGTCMIHVYVIEDEKDEFGGKLEEYARERDQQIKKVIELNLQLQDKQRTLEQSDIDQRKHIEEITNLYSSLNERMAMIQAMANIYYVSYYIDIVNNSFTEINSKREITAHIGLTGQAQDRLNYMANEMILPKYTEDMLKFVDLSTVSERLKNKNYLTFDYIGKFNGWSQANLIAGQRDENGNVLTIFYCIRSIADEKLRENEAMAVIEGLSQEYHTIWLIDKQTQEMKLIRSSGVATIQSAVTMAVGTLVFDDVVKKYIAAYVEPIDRERTTREVKNSVILEHLDKDNYYAVNYLRKDDYGKVGYHQIYFVNAGNVDGREQYVCGFRDIDNIIKEEQNLKQQLQEAKKIAENANDAKTSFLLNMSHDIRTPMNAIIGFRNLLEKYQDDPVKRADYLKKIEESSIILLSLINNVLEMARIEKGTVEVDELACSVSTLGDNIVTVFQDMMQQKNIEFTSELHCENQYVFCDTTKINEIFYNLVSNAYKYTNPGGKVNIKLEELPHEKPDWRNYRVTVSDTGIGMDEDFLPHLFDEFSRETNSQGNKIEGTGLGMPIVKRLVNLLNGTIEVQSTKGVGTTFVVTIPSRLADKSDLIEHAGVEVDPRMFKDKKILLAEDNDLNAEIAIELLSEVGFIVDRAEDGQICVDKLIASDNNYYSVILMDIQMPNLNGYDATKTIRTLQNYEKARIPILAMTANAFEEDKKRALRCGMDGHISKPINIGELMKELAVIINR